MVLVELITILKNSTALSALLGSTSENIKIMPMPLITDGVGYNFIPLISDGAVQQSQFELTIINVDLVKCYEIKEQIDKLLITIGNDNLTNTILTCSQNGGGQSYDGELKMFKLYANYTIKERMI